MAISATNLTSGNDTTGTAHITASITPTDNCLILLNVHSKLASGNGAVAPSSVAYNGTNLTFVQVQTQDEGATVGTGKASRVTLFRAMGTSTTAGTITINFAASQSSVEWSVTQISGTDTTGTNGSGAIAQTVVIGHGLTQPSPATVTMASFLSASNGTFGCGYVSSTATITAGTGLAKLSQGTQTGNSETSEWASGNVTPVAFSWPTANNTWIVFGVEIAVPSGVTPVRHRGFVR